MRKQPSFVSGLFEEESFETVPLRPKKQRKVRALNPVQNFVLEEIKPLSENQSKTLNEYEDGKNLLLIGSGGTGKTHLAIHLAMREILETKQYSKLLIMRSIVSSREIGFLPGNISEKTKQYELPYTYLFAKLFSRGDAYQHFKTKGTVEFITTSFLRGVTFEDTIIVVDETQNMARNELYTILTRIGANAKIVLCGDYKQSDLAEQYRGDERRNDILKFIKVIEQVPEFAIVRFKSDDIVRSSLVKSFILAAEKLDF